MSPPCTLVIFGAGGDLTKRLLIPAIYNLSDAKLLGDGLKILGVDRLDQDDAKLRTDLKTFIKQLAKTPGAEFGQTHIDDPSWTWLSERIFYQKGDFDDDAAYVDLAKRICGAWRRGWVRHLLSRGRAKVLRHHHRASGEGRDCSPRRTRRSGASSWRNHLARTSCRRGL